MNLGCSPRSARGCMCGANAGDSDVNCRVGPIATCMTSDFLGAISSKRPKSRFGGPRSNEHGQRWCSPALPPGRRGFSNGAWILRVMRAGVASKEGRRPRRFEMDRKPAMTALRLDDLRQHTDILRLRNGQALAVRFVEPDDAEALQGYFRSLSVGSRCNRFHGAMSELPQTDLAHFIHVGERDRFSVIAVMVIDGVETIVGEARYGFEADTASFEFGVSID